MTNDSQKPQYKQPGNTHNTTVNSNGYSTTSPLTSPKFSSETYPQKPSHMSVSALDLLESESSRVSISTGSRELDGLLGGSGLEGGRITEFCGLPGIGKTQLGCRVY